MTNEFARPIEWPGKTSAFRRRGVPVACCLLACLGLMLCSLASGWAQEPATDDPAELEIRDGRHLLELYGAEESYWEMLLDEQPIDETELEGLHQILIALGRFTRENLIEWTLPEERLPDLLADVPQHRGQLVRVSGRCVGFEVIEVPPEAARRLSLRTYYRCHLVGEGEKPLFDQAVVYSMHLPQAWIEQGQPVDREWRTAFSGALIKAGEGEAPIFVARRMEWYPWGLLGQQLGIDVAALQEVRPRSRQIDHAAFYDLLDGVGRLRPGFLIGYAKPELDATAFHEHQIRNWMVFPWLLRTATQREPDGPAARIWELLPETLQQRLADAQPDTMPDDETIALLVEAIENDVLRSPEFYTTQAFRGVYLSLEQQLAVEAGLRRLGREGVERYQRALAAAQKPSEKNPGIRQGFPASESLTLLIQRGLARLPADQLYQFNRRLMSEAFQNLVVATEPASVVPLFNSPQSQTGRIVMLEGVARRAVRVAITDLAVRQRLGIDHYYEVWLFTDDSQGNPLVVCVRELPKRMPTGDQIDVAVRVPAIFLQTWLYESLQSYAAREEQLLSQREAVSEGEAIEVIDRRLPNAPLLVAATFEILPSPNLTGTPAYAWLASTLFVLAGMSLCLLGWYFHRDDARFQRQELRPRYAPSDGVSLDDLGFEAAPEPNFRHLESRPTDEAPGSHS